MSKTQLFVPGDLNNDRIVNLEDKLLALKIITGQSPAVSFDRPNDASGDGKVGIEEALFWKPGLP